MGIIDAFSEVDRQKQELVKTLGEVECPDCGHELRYHLDKYGCEIERGDGYPNGSEILQALGPCCCEGEEPWVKSSISVLLKNKASR